MVEQVGTFGVEAVEGLVEQEQVRIVQERPAEGEALEHAARESPRPLVPRRQSPKRSSMAPERSRRSGNRYRRP